MNFYNFPPNMCTFHDDFSFKSKAILIVHNNEHIFLEYLLSSIRKYITDDDYSIIILDNSFYEPFNIHYHMYEDEWHNIYFIDNSYKCWPYENKRYVLDFNELNFCCEYPGSVMHACAVELLLNLCKANKINDVILLDFDTLLKRNVFELIDHNVLWAGETNSRENRVYPFCMYMNVAMMKKENMHFLDMNNILGISTSEMLGYDTGASLLKDTVEKNLPYKQIKNIEWIEHFGAGSYIKTKNIHNDFEYTNHTKKIIDEQFKNDPPNLKHRKIIHQWLADNIQYVV